MGQITIPTAVPPIPALQTLIFDPTDPSPGEGVFNDWATLFAYKATVATPVVVRAVVDCLDVDGNAIPAGAWAWGPNDSFEGNGFNQVTVELEDGVTFPGLTTVDNGLALVSLSSAPVILIPDSAVGIQVFRVGTRSSIKSDGTDVFLETQISGDTGVQVTICDVNGGILRGASRAIRIRYVSGASPAIAIVTARTASGVDADTIETAGPGEFALLIMQQLGFDQGTFSLDQPAYDAVTGPLAASQTFISLPGIPLVYSKATSNGQVPSPSSIVDCDTSAGNVTISQSVDLRKCPSGMIWGVGKSTSDGNIARAAPNAGDTATINGLAVDDIPNAGEIRFYVADHEANNWRLVYAANQTAAAPPAPSSTDVQVFTSNGTWVDPGAQAIRVIAIGGGGGGGGGACAPPGSERSGGGGGGAGGLVIADFADGEWGASESVTVGVGGTGGAAGVAAGSNGAPGTFGGVTTFGTLIKAGNGGGGTEGTNGADAPGGSGAFETSVAGMDPYGEGAFKSNWGGRSHRTISADWGHGGGPLPGGGGGGGGLDSSDVAQLAGNGGMGSTVAGPSGIARGDAGVTGGAPPTNGGSGAALNAAGGGGGGGAASDDDTITAQSGANGGLYGGGGGGGGAAISGGTADAGAGGNGAAGVCIVISYL